MQSLTATPTLVLPKPLSAVDRLSEAVAGLVGGGARTVDMKAVGGVYRADEGERPPARAPAPAQSRPIRLYSARAREVFINDEAKGTVVDLYI